MYLQLLPYHTTPLTKWVYVCAKQQALIRFSYLLTNVNVILAPVQPTANRGSTTVMPEKLEAVIEV